MAIRGGEKMQLPSTLGELDVRVLACRRLVKRRAWMAAGVAVLPVPGLDWLTDVGVLLKVIPEINQAFGLSAQQVAQLTPERQILVFKAISAAGGVLVGKVITQQMVWRVLHAVGVRLTTQQVVKFVPIIGQTTSAALTFLRCGMCVNVTLHSVWRFLKNFYRARPLKVKKPEYNANLRSVAQPGSATGLGPVGREFESRRSDHFRPPHLAAKKQLFFRLPVAQLDRAVAF